MEELLDHYRSWVEYQRWYLRVPGVQLAVRERGELRLSAALGTADLGSGSPLTEAHLFRIASHSKTLAAVLVLQLVGAGALRLDDAVAAHVEELVGSPVGDRTVRELLGHGGGVIRDGEDGDFWQGLHPFPDREELLATARAPSAATLGRNEHFKYSNTAYGLLGLVLLAVTGQTYADRVRTHIAEPLGLGDLAGEHAAERAAEYAAGHSALTTGRERRVLPHVDTRALAAAAGSHATARDLTAFFSALLPGEGVLLDDDLQRQQRRPQWDVKDLERRYGLGVFLDRVADTDLFGHTGGYPGHVTCTHADAEDGWVVSVLTNAIDGPASTWADALWRLRRLERTSSHAPAGPRGAGFVGRFASLWGVKDVALLGGRLFSLSPAAVDPAEDAVPLEVVGDSELRIAGGRGGNAYGETMRFERADDGTVRSVRADSGMTMQPFTVPAD